MSCVTKFSEKQKDMETFVKPKDKHDRKYKIELESWEANNSKIITWINNSISRSIRVQQAKYESTKEA